MSLEKPERFKTGWYYLKGEVIPEGVIKVVHGLEDMFIEYNLRYNISPELDCKVKVTFYHIGHYLELIVISENKVECLYEYYNKEISRKTITSSEALKELYFFIMKNYIVT